MAYYNQFECPVCHEKFESGDDIVSCPECGTPHHRSCYNSLGHCANRERHGTDFSFRRDVKGRETAENDLQQNETVTDESTNEGSHEKIDDKSVKDMVCVVRTNGKYFIPRFMKNKKASWNWAAFVFGPYYLFYRKMYKQGALFLALDFAIQLFLQAIFAKPIAAYLDYLMPYYESLGKSSASLMTYLQRMDSALVQDLFPFVCIFLGCSLVSRAIISMFSNTFYRSKVLNILSKVDKKLENGESMFEQNMIFGQESELSQFSQTKRGNLRSIYLSRVGGTTLFAPVLAYATLGLISQLISML